MTKNTHIKNVAKLSMCMNTQSSHILGRLCNSTVRKSFTYQSGTKHTQKKNNIKTKDTKHKSEDIRRYF